MGTCRILVAAAGVALLIAAGTSAYMESVFGDPPWPLRLGVAGTGVLVAIGATLIGAPREHSDDIPGSHIGRSCCDGNPFRDRHRE